MEATTALCWQLRGNAGTGLTTVSPEPLSDHQSVVGSTCLLTQYRSCFSISFPVSRIDALMLMVQKDVYASSWLVQTVADQLSEPPTNAKFRLHHVQSQWFTQQFPIHDTVPFDRVSHRCFQVKQGKETGGHILLDLSTGETPNHLVSTIFVHKDT